MVYVIFKLLLYPLIAPHLSTATSSLCSLCSIMFSVFHYASCSQSVVLGLEVAVLSPENLFEMQILGLYSWPAALQNGGGAQQLVSL